VFGTWTKWLRSLKLETHTLYLACRHPLTPWYAKALAICVIAYALSPIDLIPDPIPIVGHLDDLILVPLGVMLVLWLVPPSVLAECRKMAEQNAGKGINTRAKWIAATIIIGVWIVGAVFLARLIWFTTGG